MSLKWDEGLAAYDREQLVLRDVAAAYDQYVQDFMSRVRAALPPDIAEQVDAASLSGEGPHDWGMDWGDEWVPKCGGADVCAYNDGPGDRVVVELRLGVAEAVDWPSVAERRRLVEPGAPLRLDGARQVLESETFPLSAGDGSERVAAAFLRCIEKAVGYNRALGAGTAVGAAKWAAEALRSRPGELFADFPSRKVKTGPWQGGRFVQVDHAPPEQGLWLTCFPNATVTAHAHNAQGGNGLIALAVGAPDVRLKYQGVVLMRSDEVRAFAPGDPAAFIASLRKALKKMLDAGLTL